MQLDIPELSLVVLIGASSSGKSTFARMHFKPTEVVSSDYCRAVVANDENDQSATKDAFDLLHYIVGKRLQRGLLTVVDATNVKAADRKSYLDLARQYHVLPVGLVFDMPERVLKERHHARTDRDFPEQVLIRQLKNLRESTRDLKREGFRYVYTFRSSEEVADATVARTRLWTNRTDETGPFDIIGDVHGCYDELLELLTQLGYVVNGTSVTPPPGRKAVFVGDLVDRGPASPAVLRLVMQMVRDNVALCVPGNHDDKLLRKLRGRDVKLAHGLAETVEQLGTEPPEFIAEVKTFLDGLVSHYVLDGGRLVVAHAGLREEMQGRGSGAVRAFCLYGETTGEIDEFGLPVRNNWASEYKGRAMVVYGHTPVPDAEWLNGTIDIDTGCVFGGKLTALRYPERELLSVPAKRLYAVPRRPFLTEADAPAIANMTAQQAADDVLDMADLLGKRRIETRYALPITLPEENSIAALEVMSRFAVNPKWLIYLPPTMSPTDTSPLPDYLEHPAEAFAYYRSQGVTRVVCQEKHMGSRAVAIVCREDAVAQTRFGLSDPAPGIIYTRTGRRFFAQPDVEYTLLLRLWAALTAAGFWEKHQTDWVCLDAELMPWSAKAQDLIREQYAAVGTAGAHTLANSLTALAEAEKRGLDVVNLQAGVGQEATALARYRDAYRRYCHPTNGAEGIVLAPFHLLATEGHVHTSQPHTWHMAEIAAVCAADQPTDGAAALLLATPYHEVDLTDELSQRAAIDWWERLTQAGGEGMVVKPLDFVARGKKSLIQPAMKCRGSEYLRIIYGPDYDRPDHLSRLKNRSAGQKRALALREFALGLEALDRFVAREPLRRIHECVFGVLALESEEVDPRL